MDLIEALVLVVELGLAFYLAKKIHPKLLTINLNGDKLLKKNFYYV